MHLITKAPYPGRWEGRPCEHIGHIDLTGWVQGHQMGPGSLASEGSGSPRWF
jgi:hypothetical protein